MCIFRKFYPDIRMDSAYTIDYEKFKKEGIKGFIFDIDNTLVEHGAPANEEAVALFAKIHELGIKTALVSNNKERRVKPFADAVKSFYVHKASKPAKSGYEKAMEIMGTNHENTIFVGDQLFTDVYGAKRCKIYSILTKPIDKREEIQIVLKRYLEKIVLYFYEREEEKNAD